MPISLKSRQFRIGVSATTMVSAIALSLTGAAYAQQAGAPVVAAGEDKLAAAMAEIYDLRQRLIALEARVGAKADVDTLPAAKPDPNAVKVKLSPAPSLSTADGKTTFAIDGRVQVDAGTVIDDSGAGIGDDVDLRALWIGFSGKAGGVWRYKLQAAFENNQVAVKDAFIAFDGIKNLPIMVGNFYENNGLESFSGSTNTVFLESAAGIAAFRSSRYLGVSADPYGKNWGAQIGVFGEGIPEKAAGTGDEGYAFASRFTFAPVNEGDNLLHLGGVYRMRVPTEPTDSVRFRASGESSVIGETLIDTGNISAVEDYTTYGLEALYRYKSLSLMSEYNVTDVARSAGGDAEFGGGYVSLGWVLTGEQRDYNAARGKTGKLAPKTPFAIDGDGRGAWELAARYDTVDLTDGPVSGGEMDSYTVALNWYPTSFTRVMLNYVMNDLDNTGPAAFRDADPQYLMLRMQTDF